MSESAVARVHRLVGGPIERRKTPRHGGEVWQQPFTEAEFQNAQAILAQYGVLDGKASQAQVSGRGGDGRTAGR